MSQQKKPKRATRMGVVKQKNAGNTAKRPKRKAARTIHDQPVPLDLGLEPLPKR